MAKSVLELQESFQLLISKLKSNNKVLSIFTFGSIISGDVWEESDIDLYVVYEGEINKARRVHSEVLGVEVNIRILSKREFIESSKTYKEKDNIRNILKMSKLVFSRDIEINDIYNKLKYSESEHKKEWNLLYISNLIKELKVCKKYLQIGGLSTSYEVLIRSLDNFAKLYLSLNGYEVTKDSLTMTINLNNKFALIVDKLFYEELSKDSIQKVIIYVEDYIDNNIKTASKFLLDYLDEKEEFVSSYEIEQEECFKIFNIKVENILKELYKRNLIIKSERDLKDSTGFSILNENVYCKKNII